MRISKKILTIVLLGMLFLAFVPKQQAQASGLVAIKTSSGSNLVYRGSSEVVYRLEEFNYPTNQLRATWVSPFVGDIPAYSNQTQFKNAINAMLDQLEEYGMNAVVYHVRTHNNAMYKSELNPIAKWWANVDFDVFDPLEYVIDECHKRGIEFHAWMNPYRVSTNGTTSHYVSGTAPAVNPVHNPDNLIQVDTSIILDPGVPEVRDFLVDTCMEVIENYDVDAIHFDDYFYIKNADDTATRNKYNTEGLSVADFRRKQVDLFIEDLSKNIREYNEKNNKCIQLGISPSNVYRNGGYVSNPSYDSNGNLSYPLYSNTGGFAHYGDYLYSDTLNWINHEWIDYIMPQCYHSLENTAAPFADVTRWWTWAVRNKKVNFYAGLGIYMALDNQATWLRHDNEIELQLLYGGQYEDFSGACFYKYGSLKDTSNSVVADAVDTISNDFWKVRIPGAINKYYAPITAEVQPTNVRYNSDTKTISFDAIDNVRGYMVYKVPKGAKLDKTNIDHVYGYVQETSVTITDTSCDYYVASVNLANEVSEATYVYTSLSANDVISLINEIPANISINDKQKIEEARKLYDLLSTNDQAKVTNISKLTSAELALTKIETVSQELDAYVSKLDLHIKENRKVELPANMTLDYKNANDASLYNISTGEKLKNPLATTLIPLVITLTKDGVVVSKEVNFNIGLTGTDQVGLFYRNDPSCLNADDSGNYGPSISGWIGWSGHTVVVDNMVLYIASQNYIEITDASNISKAKWTSVAGVYVNKTDEDITISMSNLFDSHSSTKDGYFVISKDMIKETYDGFDAAKSVTLAPGDAYVLVRYLDSSINNNRMCPVSQLTVGTKAYIDNETPKTDDELVSEVIELINSIPASVTLEDEIFINSINEKYLLLSDDAKAKVTNYSNLKNALSTIESIKQAIAAELANRKSTVISSLEEYLNDIDTYSEESLSKIEKLVNEYKTLINAATAIEDVDSKYNECLLLIEELPTLAEELEEYKAEKLESLDTLVNMNLYSTENKATIQEYLEAAKTNINNAASVANVDTVLEALNYQISNVKTLASERTSYVSDMTNYINQVTTNNALKTELNKIKTKYTTAINNATSNLQAVYNNFEAEVDKYIEDLENAKSTVISQINAYVEGLDYTEKELAHISTVKTNKINAIETLVKVSDVEASYQEFVNHVEELHEELVSYKSTKVESLSELVLETYTDAQVTHINSLIEAIKADINNAGNEDEIDGLIADLTSDINSYVTSLNNKITEANTYLDSKNSRTDSDIKALVATYKELVANAGSTTQVEEYVAEFDEAYAELTKVVTLDEIKANAKAEIEAYIAGLDYSKAEIAEISKMKNTTFTNIDNAPTENVVNIYKQQFKSDVEGYHTNLANAKEEAKNTVNSKIAETDSAASLITVTLGKIDAASTTSEITSILNEFERDFDERNTTSSLCSSNTVVLLIGYITTAFSLLALTFKRKK